MRGEGRRSGVGNGPPSGGDGPRCVGVMVRGVVTCGERDERKS